MKNLPENVEYVFVDSRSINNQYKLKAGKGLVFPFSLNSEHYLMITAGDTFLMNTQELSLRLWFGQKPWNQADIDIKLVHNSLNLRRSGTDFVFYEKNKKKPTQFENERNKIFVPITPNKIYYCNIQNLENQENTFELSFLHEKII